MLKLKNELFPVEAREKWENREIIKAIHRSQHCQRNYDLTQTIPVEDVKTIITAATQCPSKQNTAFYDLYVIVNRDIINGIYESTTSLHSDDPAYKGLSNPQVLANMLLVFADKAGGPVGVHKELAEAEDGVNLSENERILLQDKMTAVGLAAGYVNLTSSLLGYATGCCSCVMNADKVQDLLGISTRPLLLMGVGFDNPDVNRRMHQLRDTEVAKQEGWKEKFTTLKKEQIGIYYVK